MTREIIGLGLLIAVLLLLVGFIVRAIILKLRSKTRWPGKIFYLVIYLGLATYLISIPWVIFTRDVEESRATRCTANLHAIIVALRTYSDDNNNTFPPADAWCDRLKPYIVSDRIFVCPEAPRLRCGYAINAALGGRKLDGTIDSGRVVAVFESDKGWNAHGGIGLLPLKPRHPYGYRYVHVDGDTDLVNNRNFKELIWTPSWNPKEKH